MKFIAALFFAFSIGTIIYPTNNEIKLYESYADSRASLSSDVQLNVIKEKLLTDIKTHIFYLFDIANHLLDITEEEDQINFYYNIMNHLKAIEDDFFAFVTTHGEEIKVNIYPGRTANSSNMNLFCPYNEEAQVILNSIYRRSRTMENKLLIEAQKYQAEGIFPCDNDFVGNVRERT